MDYRFRSFDMTVGVLVYLRGIEGGGGFRKFLICNWGGSKFFQGCQADGVLIKYLRRPLGKEVEVPL